MTSTPLAGRAVVVTRPIEQADGLARLIRTAGGEPILFPAIEIVPPADPAALAAAVADLTNVDLAIFISPTAVERTFAVMKAWPARLVAAAVGPATATALADRGVAVIIRPNTQFDSEGLLECPELGDVAGRRVVIFRGSGGRELLGSTLIARGARVAYASAYQRVPTRADPSALITRWRAGGIAATVFTSSEGLGFFAQRIGASDWPLVQATPAFVSHPRMAAAARAHGIARIVTSAPGDDAICSALGAYFRG